MSRAIVPLLVVNHAIRGMDVHRLGAAYPSVIPDLRKRIARDAGVEDDAGVEGVESLDALLAMSPDDLRYKVLIATRDGDEGRLRTLLAVASPRHLRHALLYRPISAAGADLSRLPRDLDTYLDSLLFPPGRWTQADRDAAIAVMSTWTTIPASELRLWDNQLLADEILLRESPIYLATKMGLAKVVKQLLEHLADEQLMPPHYRGTSPLFGDQTPLMIAARKGNADIVHTMLLTEPTKQLAARSGEGRTPLKIAILMHCSDEKGREDVARAMLKFDLMLQLQRSVSRR